MDFFLNYFKNKCYIQLSVCPPGPDQAQAGVPGGGGERADPAAGERDPAAGVPLLGGGGPEPAPRGGGAGAQGRDPRRLPRRGPAHQHHPGYAAGVVPSDGKCLLN